MKITRINANGTMVVEKARNVDYAVSLTNNVGASRSIDGYTYTASNKRLSVPLNTFKTFGKVGDSLEVGITSDDGIEDDVVQFVNGTLWQRPQDPLWITTLFNTITSFIGRNSMRIWKTVGVLLFLTFLVCMWLFIDPVGRYENYKKSRAASEVSTSSPITTNPSIEDVARNLETGPHQNDSQSTSTVDNIQMPRRGSLIVSNSSLGPIYVSSTNSTNVVIIAGRDVKFIAGGDENDRGVKPPRKIRLTPDETMKIGAMEEKIYSVEPWGTVVFQLPSNWSVETFSDPDFLDPEFTRMVNNETVVKNGEYTGTTITYVNETRKTMRVGVRCTKLKEKSPDEFKWQ